MNGTSLPVATLARDEGEQLISRLGKGPVRLRAISQPTEYLYDLVRRWEHTIPGELTYRPKQHDLARIDVDFRNDPADKVIEHRFDIIPHTNFTSGYPAVTLARHHRTDWVTAGDSVQWTSVAEVLSKELQYSEGRYHQPGSTGYEQWFGPFQRPRINQANQLPSRTGDNLSLQVPAWGESGNDHVGYWGSGSLGQSVALYQGQTLIGQTEYDYLGAALSPARLPYRLVATTERDASAYPYSTRTHTEWRFTSETVAAGQSTSLPLIQLDYDLDTDLEGRASRSAALTITPLHLPGVPKSNTIRSSGLDVSYDDGATWHTERLTQTSKGWKTTLHAPARARYVTVRAHAQDKQGNSVEQTMVRAFGLR
jgi:hypothetical protein